MLNESADIGIVCGQCDWFCTMGSAVCPSCNYELSLVVRRSESALPQLRPRALIACRGASLHLAPGIRASTLAP